MKDIFTVLGKKNGKNAVSLSSLRKDIRELESFLEDHHVECRIKDDEDLIKWSAVRTALEQKDQLDDVLYRSLDSMQDYMHTLQYEDINRLLMLDIHQVSDALHHFDRNGTAICMPCFDEEFNRRYLCSPAMFTYPQYQRLLRGYQPYLRWGMYGDAPYANGFGLCECLYEDRASGRIVLYLRKANRLYLMESAQVIETLCLEVKAVDQMDDALLSALAESFCALDVQRIVELLSSCSWMKDRQSRKLQKLAQ